MDKDAEYFNLRAAGAFLVSSELKNGKVTRIEITADNGGVIKMVNPFDSKKYDYKGKIGLQESDGIIKIPTIKGQKIVLTSKSE